MVRYILFVLKVPVKPQANKQTNATAALSAGGIRLCWLASANGCWLLCATGPPGMSGSSQIATSSSHEPSAAAGGSSGGGGGPMLAGGDTVEQIALTLLRLQQDMYNVLIRLQSLETLTQQQVSHFLLYFIQLHVSYVVMLAVWCVYNWMLSVLHNCLASLCSDLLP